MSGSFICCAARRMAFPMRVNDRDPTVGPDSGALSVSGATTRTVVSSALTILALDLVLTAFMLRGGS